MNVSKSNQRNFSIKI